MDLAAFRIVQEALTNVVRHADTPDCRVTIGNQDGELTIEVADDGRGGLTSGTGYGITGMRERVSLLRGQFTAYPRPEGGFRVAARLPSPKECTSHDGPRRARRRPAIGPQRSARLDGRRP
ncbi:ATP-binding protein [Streptomyces stramineus]